MQLIIPDRLTRAIVFLRGQQDGEAWLRALPRRVEIYLRRWDLSPLEVAEGGAMSFCLFCLRADGSPAVLKIPVDAASGRLEIRSLGRWARSGASPHVLAQAPSSGVFLMSRVFPGTTATPTGRPSDAHHLCDLITRMHRPELGPMRGLRTIEAVTRMRFDWARDRFVDAEYEPEVAQLPGAEQLLRILTDSSGPPQVIHGDLQAKNILLGPDDRWQAIDPFTCTGELDAEAALWAVVQEDGSAIEDRISQLAACELLTEARLRAWTYIFAVAEYRHYSPINAERIRAFTTRLEWRHLAAATSPPI